MSRILLLNDAPTEENWGVRAMPVILKRMLKENIPHLEIRSLGYSWLQKRFRRLKWFPSIFEERASWPLFWRLTDTVEFFPTLVDDFEYAADEWQAGRGGPMAQEFILYAQEAQAIVFNGEQAIYRNNLEAFRALFLLWFARTRLGKLTCLINHTAHLTEVVPVINGIVKEVYPVLDLVTVREPASFRNLQNLGLRKLHLVPDVVFYFSRKDFGNQHAENWKEINRLLERPYFCFSDSSLPMSKPQARREGAVVSMVRCLKTLGLQAVLMAKDRRSRFFKAVAEQTDSVFFGPEHSYGEIWSLLKDCQFLVSGRYHLIIMSSMVGCPFLPLTANTHKIRGICEYLRWPIQQPFDATALSISTEQIAEEARRLYQNRSRYSEHLVTRCAQLHAESVRNATLIQDLLV